MGLGVALGTSLGVVFDQLALLLPLGIAIGAGLGSTGMFANNRESDSPAKKEVPKDEP